jgi:branched-chain amino acid transport system substrate-binding protein
MKSIIDENGGAIWINPNAGNDNLIKDGCTRYHFRIGWSNWHNSVPMAQWALDNVADNVFLTYADYTAGTQYTQNFAQAFEELGGTVVGQASSPLGTEDFSPLLQQVQSSDADAVWSFHPGADAVNYINGVADFGINEEKDQLCPGFMLSQTTLPAQGEAALGMRSILHYTYNKDIEKNREFRQNFSSEYDARANVYACSGYDAAQTIEKAVNETDGTEVDPTIDALRGAEIVSPRGTFTIDAQRQDPHMSLDIRQVASSDSGPPINEVVDTLGKKRVPFTCDF